MEKISIIIPTLNEEGNIKPLIERIDSVLKSSNILYEIIFIDDHSTDKTQEIIAQFANRYPVSLYLKEGREGKAYSLLEGFKKAKYDLLGIIDADLQYPPEVIPKMIDKINNGAGAVVANRKEKRSSLLRKITSVSFRTIFGKLLHGFDVDVQSGLKIFRKEIIERISLDPTAWTFDLEFLIKARDAGYSIDHISIMLDRRFFGKSKVNILKTSLEIGLSSLKLKLTTPKLIPFSKERIKTEGMGFHYRGRKYTTYTDLENSESAFHRFYSWQSLFLLVIAALFTLGLYLNWHKALIISFGILTVLYFSDLIFNFFLIYRSLRKFPEINVEHSEINKEREWPSYTIFCPLYKEWKVLPQFITAMNRLDYPRNKLQILLLLEENDPETIKKAKTLNLPEYFKVAIVPHSIPKTKPKACNFGLSLAKGEYSVIYDAEDVPEPSQLKKAVVAFEKAGKNISCIQAKLNFYNPHQNVLTKVFTAEYSLWFDLVLPGLQSLNAPIPLGGTSNHFKTSSLKKIKGWDAFNVTEDCDLGIRLTELGYKTAIINSTTMEEANSSFINWFPQRVRWIKGYIQTYSVHMRHPKEFINSVGIPRFTMFNLIVGGKILSTIINPLMWITTVTYFIARPVVGDLIESFFPAPVFYMAVFSLIFGNFLYFYYYMIGCAKRKQFDIIKYTYLVPLYWWGMSIAAWIAFYKVFNQPFYWSKTQHGLHLDNLKTMELAQETLGLSLVDRKFRD